MARKLVENYHGTYMKLPFFKKIKWLVIPLLGIVSFYFVYSEGKIKGTHSNILSYEHVRIDGVVQNKDTIELFGYKDVGNGFAPQVLKTTNGGKSWKETLFDATSSLPSYFQVDSVIFLYAYETNREKATVYVSSDFGDSWKQVGEHSLSRMSVPVFGEYLQNKQTIDMLHSVECWKEWDCSNLQTFSTLLFPSHKDEKIKNVVGNIDLKSGKIERISTGKFHFIDAVFAENNTDWILGRSEGNEGVYLIQNDKDSVKLVAHWPKKKNEKFGIDQPQALYVKDSLIVAVIKGVAFLDPGLLFYSKDGGMNWTKKKLPTSNLVRILFNEDDKELIVVCVTMMAVDIFNIELR